ncbi:DNA-3-methyladenine glycosylase [Psychrobacillus insolitus]|uniref:Putative 3-methyladenine DNA glycosylase n=1 Tax=Psychrobacillus insolitus TaxID=1461 RepID=A0A2W7PBA5_9BACI|nr:DNA-3-methyladenine glycosylase [Psychrobacillus insolitus]PZX03888.1 DNA-3-methyladenine glycosylase [Psychrobacillus insolitus]
MKPLNVAFFHQPTLELARDLLGKYMVHEQETGLLIGKIVETEAYMGAEDKAAHSYGNRRTKRTEVMFGEPGLIYTYQMHTHTLINVVAGVVGIPNAILIRAVEPIEGLERMNELRNNMPMKQWTNGPGKLTKAMAITMDYYGKHWSEKPLYIAEGEQVKSVSTGPRIGIDNSGEAVHYPYRFWETDNPYVSKWR